jgi:hypothetical protein
VGAELADVAGELVVRAFVVAELVVPEFDGVDAFGCVPGCRCDVVTGALRVGVVCRFVVCAKDAGESASDRAICNRSSNIRGWTNEFSGNANKGRGNESELKGNFIRGSLYLIFA